ncbi:Beta-1,3-glucanase, Osmotin/thaumatin-like superfamily, glucan endo-1,3-beta-glucosidase [Madurella fahalii]|uniref:Beta-1,3-glucanase, Osmotin/thaumatin-like superfamily, glucan endo-1,3-beta-glucosidase n=1 Tax=Madurella fahalii TaxID=1157608 RepID=A0ABQ0GA75_9PEZI
MPDALTIQLVNHSTTPNVYAFITGLAIQRDMARVFLKADGRTLYFPESPPGGKILQPLTEDCAIPLGPPGASVAVTIPQMAGGRIWFSAESKLTFLRNPAGRGGGAALVEPSVLNPTDPNANTDFAFCEFTLNADQLFANITYVDFVPRLPIALTLQTRSGEVQHVSGMPPDGLERVCARLRAQAAKDGQPWDKLVVQRRGQDRPLRVLSPTHAGAIGASFAGYFEPLVEVAWDKYALQVRPHHRLPMFSRGHEPRAVLRIDTQAAPGVLEGTVHRGSDKLVIGSEEFARPTTADILGCNSGPFTTGPSPTRNAIIPRLAAAFQRSSIVVVADHPSHPETFYRCEPTNHYARIVHQCNLDSKGYAFAYDDVQPDGGADQSGKVNAGDPAVLIVAVGGRSAYVGNRMA